MRWVIVVIAVAMLCGCKVREVVVTEHHTDTCYVGKVMRDSVYMRDSVFVMKSGDTITTYRTSIVYRDRWRTDTVYRTTRDSVPYPVVIEKGLTKWQRLCVESGKLALGLIVLVVIYAAVRIVSRR